PQLSGGLVPPLRGRAPVRFDRVESAEVLDDAARPPAEAAAAPPGQPRRNTALPTAIIEIDPAERWLLEYYDAEPLDADSDPDVPVRATLTYGSPEWLARTLASFGGRVRLVSDDADARRAQELVVAGAVAARERYLSQA
ncbi:MAG: WYL domain-containing protein, partial [Gordonia sp. (in: high G+C Gram-positive bacteria)]